METPHGFRPHNENETPTMENTVSSEENHSDTVSAPIESAYQKSESLLGRVHEGMYKIPGVRRVVGNMEIAYNQHWTDRANEKAVRRHEKLSAANLKISALEGSRDAMLRNIEEGTPGADSLRLKAKKFEADISKLAIKRNRVQSRVEKWQNKAGGWTEKRDAIADKLIGSYETQLSPFEKELEGLNLCKDRAELRFSVMEANHQVRKQELQGIQAQRDEIAEALRQSGMKEKRIMKFGAIKVFDERIAMEEEAMRNEHARNQQVVAATVKEVAKVDKRANPYRDCREEFIRIKENRPSEMKMEERKKREDKYTDYERNHTSAHPRGEGTEDGGQESTSESASSPETPASSEKAPLFDVDVLVADWNEYLEEKYKKPDMDAKVDIVDFFRETGFMGQSKMREQDFKVVYARYAKVKKFKPDMQDVDTFLKKREDKRNTT